MARVLFINPNFDTYVMAPPLGILYLSSYIKKYCNAQTLIIDALRDNLKDEDIVQKANEYKPDIIGISCLTAVYKQTISIAKALKQAGYKVFIGGVHPTFMPYTTLKDSGADFVIAGEGELPLLKICQNNFNHKNIQGVYDIESLKDDETQINGLPVIKAETVMDLDTIPMPDWQQLPPASYPHSPHAVIARGNPIGILMTSRGCPSRCTFCSSNNFYKGIRQRSVANVMEEVKYQVEVLGVNELQFTDDNLTLKKDYIIELCNALIKNNINVPWSTPNGVRADRVDEEILDLMKKSGCYLIDFGIESANNQILKNIRKGETIEQIDKSIVLAHKAGMITQGNFIFGLPGETRETMQETIDYAVNSKLDRAGFFALRLLPGSDLSKKMKGKYELDCDHSFISKPDWLPDNLTEDEILRTIQKVYWKFYFRPRRLWGLLNDIPVSQTKYILKAMINYHLFKLW